MSSDEGFTALGPAIIGFQTDGANIERGADVAGTTLGVVGRGPTGVKGVGEEDGVVGEGGAGRGGRFTSRDGHAQLNLAPHLLPEFGRSTDIVPKQLTKAGLPRQAKVGDLLMTRLPEGDTPCALWICVVEREKRGAAVWSQVLLGGQIAGSLTPIDE